MTPSPRPSQRLWLGYIFLALAGLGWSLCLILPFTPLPSRFGLATAALIIAEVSFLVGLGLLGRTYYRQLKDRLRRRLRRQPQSKL